MNKRVKKIVTVAAFALLSAVFTIIMYFCSPSVYAVPETTGEIQYTVRTYESDGTHTVENVTAVIGKDVTAVSITDISKLGKITSVNYVPDKFVKPRDLDKNIQIVDLTKPFDFAEKGTIIIIVMNLDPFAEDFYEQADKLEEYKIGDYWHFTVHLPVVFGASNIYNGSNLVARNGDIANYDFIDFSTTYDISTEKYKSHTDTALLDLSFYGRRQAMNPYQMITIHYQSSGTVYSGMKDCPLIGKESDVKRVTENSQNLVIILAIVTAVVLAVLIVLSFLKHTLEFIPAAIWISGIAGIQFSDFLAGLPTDTPLLWAAVGTAAPFLALGGALLAVSIDFRKIKILKYAFPALAVLGGLLAFICPFVPFGAATGLTVAFRVVKGVCAAVLAVAVFFDVVNRTDGILKATNATLICVAITAALFLPHAFPKQIDSTFYMCAVIVVTTFISVLIVIKETEQTNSYLTKNLNLEVERQLKDIRAVITERDNLLQFVSHDMKKPLQSSDVLLDTLIERESDDEQVKALRIVKQNVSRVTTNLSQIGDYARFNYIAEQSQTVDLKELCAEIYDFHLPDCNANGIRLENLVDKSCKVYVKRQGLENAVSNIILNAIEHADCNTISIYVKPQKSRVTLCIADDGKGIENTSDVFSPYVSKSSPDTGGLGLFICKNIVESMNGELSFESVAGNTVFLISLLKA